MGENTGFILFLWIVGAPTIGFLLLSLRTQRRSAWEVGYGPAPAQRTDRRRYSSDDSNLPL